MPQLARRKANHAYAVDRALARRKLVGPSVVTRRAGGEYGHVIALGEQFRVVAALRLGPGYHLLAVAMNYEYDFLYHELGGRQLCFPPNTAHVRAAPRSTVRGVASTRGSCATCLTPTLSPEERGQTTDQWDELPKRYICAPDLLAAPQATQAHQHQSQRAEQQSAQADDWHWQCRFRCHANASHGEACQQQRFSSL